MPDDQTSLVLSVQAGKLEEFHVKDPYKVDLHHHTFFSGYDPTRTPQHMYVPTSPTELLHVHECHSEPLEVLIALEAAGMTGFTFLDHDSVRAMTTLVDRYRTMNDRHTIFSRKKSRIALLELAERYEKAGFTSCEYSVNTEQGRNQIIHVGVYGLDFAEGSRERLPPTTVHELHRELSEKAKLGYVKFGELCKKLGLSFAFMHPLWQSSADDPLSAEQLDELTDYFPFLEINSDHQYENLAALLIAIDKNKPVIAGSDDHALRRSGGVYTSTLDPVSTPREFLDELAAGRVGIGSRFHVPSQAKAKEGNEMDRLTNIIKHMFYGHLCEYQKDAYKITRDHIMGKGNCRNPTRYLTLGLGLGIPAVISALGYPEIGLPLFAGELLPLATIPFIMTGIEKMETNISARRLHGTYNRLVKSRHIDEIAKERSVLERERAKLDASIDELDRRQEEIDRRYPERIPRIRSKQGRVSSFCYRMGKKISFMRRTSKELVPEADDLDE